MNPDKLKFNLHDFVYGFKTQYKEGFTAKELYYALMQVSEHFDINLKKYRSAMMGNTCMLIDDEVITYHCDVLTALRCGIEDRDMYGYEFD